MYWSSRRKKGMVESRVVERWPVETDDADSHNHTSSTKERHHTTPTATRGCGAVSSAGARQRTTMSRQVQGGARSLGAVDSEIAILRLHLGTCRALALGLRSGSSRSSTSTPSDSYPSRYRRGVTRRSLESFSLYLRAPSLSGSPSRSLSWPSRRAARLPPRAYPASQVVDIESRSSSFHLRRSSHEQWQQRQLIPGPSTAAPEVYAKQTLEHHPQDAGLERGEQDQGCADGMDGGGRARQLHPKWRRRRKDGRRKKRYQRSIQQYMKDEVRDGKAKHKMMTRETKATSQAEAQARRPSGNAKDKLSSIPWSPGRRRNKTMRYEEERKKARGKRTSPKTEWRSGNGGALTVVPGIEPRPTRSFSSAPAHPTQRYALLAVLGHHHHRAPASATVVTVHLLGEGTQGVAALAEWGGLVGGGRTTVTGPGDAWDGKVGEVDAEIDVDIYVDREDGEAPCTVDSSSKTKEYVVASKRKKDQAQKTVYTGNKKKTATAKTKAKTQDQRRNANGKVKRHPAAPQSEGRRSAMKKQRRGAGQEKESEDKVARARHEGKAREHDEKREGKRNEKKREGGSTHLRTGAIRCIRNAAAHSHPVLPTGPSPRDAGGERMPEHIPAILLAERHPPLPPRRAASSPRVSPSRAEGEVVAAWVVGGPGRREKLPKVLVLRTKKVPGREEQEGWSGEIFVFAQWTGSIHITQHTRRQPGGIAGSHCKRGWAGDPNGGRRVGVSRIAERCTRGSMWRLRGAKEGRWKRRPQEQEGDARVAWGIERTDDGDECGGHI
ncbi:hypothetical protein C8R45DRAFT_1136865 [Mycena sanguinolenta]|nr:hypothetical protein C8R45DRAFT_1136865 [Mycena sanguinolenta]